MKRTLGRFGEEWAIGYLIRLGYTILERNVRFRTGEIDIVARDGEGLVFVEVKSRRSRAFGLPEESITPARYRRLESAIQEYLSRTAPQAEAYRVDLLCIEVGRDGRVGEARLLRGVEPPGW